MATTSAESAEMMFRHYGNVRSMADPYSSLVPTVKHAQAVAEPSDIGRMFSAPSQFM